MKFKIGAARISVASDGFRKHAYIGRSMARAAGIYFDICNIHLFGIAITIMRLMESDFRTSLLRETHAGYLVSDRIANPYLPSYSRYY